MAPCVRGLRRGICRHRLCHLPLGKVSLRGGPDLTAPRAGYLLPGLLPPAGHSGGKEGVGVGATKTDAAALPSFAAPTSLRNNGEAVRRELVFTQTPPAHCAAAQAGPRGATVLPPSRLSHIAESFMAAARAETVWTRQAGSRGKEAQG